MYNIVFKHKLLQSSNCIGCKYIHQQKESNKQMIIKQKNTNIWEKVSIAKLNEHTYTLTN